MQNNRLIFRGYRVVDLMVEIPMWLNKDQHAQIVQHVVDHDPYRGYESDDHYFFTIKDLKSEKAMLQYLQANHIPHKVTIDKIWVNGAYDASKWINQKSAPTRMLDI